MTVGLQQINSKRYNLLRVVDASAVDVAAPTTAAHGVDLPDNLQGMMNERCVVLIWNSAGTGALAIAYAKIWGYVAEIDKWFPLGTASLDADRGKLNEGAALGVVAADTFRFAEEVFDIASFDRIAVELNGVAGTNDTWTVDILIPKRFALAA